MQVAPDNPRLLRQACLAEGVAVPLVPVSRGADRAQVTEEPDAPVPAADQVRDARRRALPVVGYHAAGAWPPPDRYR
jgi:hypothetical protein